jgi:hypothetical protein
MSTLPLSPNHSVLFLDDHWISRHTYVWREIGSPQRISNFPVLSPDRPWEGACIIPRSAVYDEARALFRLWYQSFNLTRPSPENMYLCYAESADGLRWDKPNVGQVLYRGSKENNIVAGNLGGLEEGSGGFDCPNVVEDRADPDPERRFKLFLYTWAKGRAGYVVGTSPDGLAWQLSDKAVLTKEQVWDTNTLLIDRTLDRPFVSLNRHAKMYEIEHRRSIYRSDSSDFENWTEPELCFAPDLADEPRLQYYGMSSFRYGEQYIGLLQVLHRNEHNPNLDRQSVRLVVSRDSKNWKAVEPRRDFFSPGAPGSFDEKWIYFPPPVSRSESAPLIFFYDGRSTGHEPFIPCGAVGSAILRRDAFCSISSGHEVEGLLETVPFTMPQGELCINARTDHGGTIRAEIIGLDTNEILASQPLEKLTPGSRLYAPLVWPGGVPSSLIGRRVALRFYLRAAHLFSFRFVADK